MELTPPRVFICYCSQDYKRANDLYDSLERAGADPWMDKKKLVLGDDFESEIKKAVERADVFVVCLRPGFDEIGFRQREVKWALDALDRRPPCRGFIIPFLLEPCGLPSWCKRFHAGSNLNRSPTIDELVAAVEKHAGRTLRPRHAAVSPANEHPAHTSDAILAIAESWGPSLKTSILLRDLEGTTEPERGRERLANLLEGFFPPSNIIVSQGSTSKGKALVFGEHLLLLSDTAKVHRLSGTGVPIQLSLQSQPEFALPIDDSRVLLVDRNGMAQLFDISIPNKPIPIGNVGLVRIGTASADGEWAVLAEESRLYLIEVETGALLDSFRLDGASVEFVSELAGDGCFTILYGRPDHKGDRFARRFAISDKRLVSLGETPGLVGQSPMSRDGSRAIVNSKGELAVHSFSGETKSLGIQCMREVRESEPRWDFDEDVSTYLLTDAAICPRGRFVAVIERWENSKHFNSQGTLHVFDLDANPHLVATDWYLRPGQDELRLGVSGGYFLATNCWTPVWILSSEVSGIRDNAVAQMLAHAIAFSSGRHLIVSDMGSSILLCDATTFRLVDHFSVRGAMIAVDTTGTWLVTHEATSATESVYYIWRIRRRSLGSHLTWPELVDAAANATTVNFPPGDRVGLFGESAEAAHAQWRAAETKFGRIPLQPLRLNVVDWSLPVSRTAPSAY